MRKLIAFIAVATAFISTPTSANSVKITDGLIEAKNDQMANILTVRNPQQTMNFLHYHISDEAVFQVSFENPFLPEGVDQKPMEMDKVSYIKTFIDGLHYVDSYKVDINTDVLQISEDGSAALVEEVMTEQGVMLNPNNLNMKGIPFVSQTTCQTYYTLNNGVVQSNKAQCKTETGKVGDI